MPAGTSSNPCEPSPSLDSPAAMPVQAAWADKRVIVMGLGRFGGGVGAARWFAGQGARVVVTDLADKTALRPSIAQLSSFSIDYQLGGHDTGILDGCDLLVVNPAISKERSPFFAEAVHRGVNWTTEINLFLERCPGFVIGVTGSAGKSTTAAMIHACLKSAEPAGQVYLGGNIGCSLLNELVRMTPDDTVVLELSSFQLADLLSIGRLLDAGVIVTLWPQHLDRHGSFESYMDCKLNLIRGAKPGATIVLGVDDRTLLRPIERIARESDVRVMGAPEPASDYRLQVPGWHNRLNARCATALCKCIGLGDDAVRKGLETFQGLPHRLEFVGEYAGVTFFNDSKATSPRAAATGLRAFDQPVIVLIGGQFKDIELDELVAAVAERAKAAICFGAAGQVLQTPISAARTSHPELRIAQATTLKEAVGLAREVARPGDIVLLSPGFPSFDEFDNYEDRGRAFISLVRALFAKGE